MIPNKVYISLPEAHRGRSSVKQIKIRLYPPAHIQATVVKPGKLQTKLGCKRAHLNGWIGIDILSFKIMAVVARYVEEHVLSTGLYVPGVEDGIRTYRAVGTDMSQQSRRSILGLH